MTKKELIKIYRQTAKLYEKRGFYCCIELDHIDPTKAASKLFATYFNPITQYAWSFSKVDKIIIPPDDYWPDMPLGKLTRAIAMDLMAEIIESEGT